MEPLYSTKNHKPVKTMVVLESLFPVFALIILGIVLKISHFTNEAFFAVSDRLIYYFFFPVMLFWKIGSAQPAELIDKNFFLAIFAALLCVFLLSTLYIILLKVADFQAGSFSQSCYRFNTYVGMAIMMTAIGESGVHCFGVLIGMVIPLLNILAVSVLIWYSGAVYSLQQRMFITLKALGSNPLIIACLAGFWFSNTDLLFPDFLSNTFQLASWATLPLALLSIGGALNFNNLRGYLGLAIAASVFKLLLLPLVGYGFLILFNVSHEPFKVGMIFFALPTSTAIYVLSSQLNSDTELASASILLSTILSLISLSAALVLV
jgi:predicted permease